MKGKSLTATIREAVEHEFERESSQVSFMERLEAIQDAFEALGEPTGKLADKAFYDELSGEDDLIGKV